MFSSNNPPSRLVLADTPSAKQATFLLRAWRADAQANRERLDELAAQLKAAERQLAPQSNGLLWTPRKEIHLRNLRSRIGSTGREIKELDLLAEQLQIAVAQLEIGFYQAAIEVVQQRMYAFLRSRDQPYNRLNDYIYVAELLQKLSEDSEDFERERVRRREAFLAAYR